MAHKLEDRVLETSTTVGANPFVLEAAVGYRRFGDVMAAADTTYYSIVAVNASGQPTGEWETGVGTYGGANTLQRTSVQRSSNGNALVVFGVGKKLVFMAQIASKLVMVDPSGTTKVGALSATTGAFSGDVTIAMPNPDVHGLSVTATTGTNAAAAKFANTSGNFFVGVDSADGSRITGDTPYARAIWSESNYPIVFGVNNVKVASLSSSTFAITPAVTMANGLSVQGAAITYASGLGIKSDAYDGGVFSDATYQYFGKYSTARGLKIAHADGTASFTDAVTMASTLAVNDTLTATRSGSNIIAMIADASDFQIGLKRPGNDDWYLRNEIGNVFGVHLNGTGDIITASATGVAIAGSLTASERINSPSYTVGTLPAAGVAGGQVYVSNESGGAVLAFSDGTNWRRVTDRAVVS